MKLQVHQSTAALENVAPGRPMCSVVELQERVLAALANGMAVFVFLKQDQTQRLAIGTLRADLIPDVAANKRIQGVLNLAESLVRLFDETPLPERKKSFLNKITPLADAMSKLISPPDKKERKASSSSQVFFDLQAMSWKAYAKDNLLALIEL